MEMLQNASPLIDQLTYSYQQNSSSNKLDLVSDASGSIMVGITVMMRMVI